MSSDIVARLRNYDQCHDGDVDEAADMIERLQRDLAEIYETHKRIVNGECASDEKHCTCVPALHAEIKRLRAERDALIEAMEVLHHGHAARVILSGTEG